MGLEIPKIVLLVLIFSREKEFPKMPCRDCEISVTGGIQGKSKTVDWTAESHISKQGLAGRTSWGSFQQQ